LRYVRVRSIDALLGKIATPGATILCGGTDLLVKMHSGLARPELLVDISEVKELRGVRQVGDAVEIGAATPEEDLLNSPVVRERLPLLARVLRVLGSPQIRSRGTLGGNLANASPAADSAVPLLLYDAEVVLQAPRGERHVPVESFFVGPGETVLEPGEFIRAVRVPVPSGPFFDFHHKVGRRRALTIAIASVGCLLRIDGARVEDARLAAGSVAPVPLRLRPVERFLVGVRLEEATIAAAGRAARDCVSPISDVRASADYRRDVVGELVSRSLHAALL
jgi:CO/xanthine dehydrogenase FAD-binding subunit